jgi:hypothetical protein
LEIRVSVPHRRPDAVRELVAASIDVIEAEQAPSGA